MKEGIDRQVEGFIEEVGLYSKEHRDYLDKLNRVLEEMNQSGSPAERQNYNSFKETIRSFEKYLTDRKIELSRHERERFAVIASSGLGSLAKKRMAEDLMHAVKERHASESGTKIEEEKRKREIAALSRSHLYFVNWYRLLMYALDYGTITPFTHLYKASTLDVIRVNFVSWYRKIEGELFRILDDYYYYLSTHEYNVLVMLAESGTAAERFNELKKHASYDPSELFDLMEDFTSRYICVIRNVSAIDRALKKVFKERQAPHGFMGYIGFLTDRPLQNNMVVRLTGGSMMRNSVCGVLYSFYTSYFGVRVMTFNQLVYLTGSEGVIDEDKKHLTQGAIQRLNEEEKKRDSNDFRIKSRLDELEPLTTRYTEMGSSLAEKVFSLDKTGAAASRDQNRPLYRLLRIIEGYIKYILDPVVSGSGMTIEYEDKKADNFFSRYTELVRAASDFVNLGQELQGSRGRDIVSFRVPPAAEGTSLIEVLADNDQELPRIEGARFMRETLSAISSKAYNLCTRFNEIIIRFNSEGRSEPPDFMDRYDFAVNSRIKHSKIRSMEMILSKKELSVMDFIEAGCSLAIYISAFFGHKGIRALQGEVEKLKSEMNMGDSGRVPEQSVTEKAGGEDDEVAVEVDRTYSDRLTGIRKWEYFEDFILPVYYDDKKCYNGNAPRYVFCCEISNLSEINRISGNDTGDLVYKKIVDLINFEFAESGIENIILRTPGGILTGYITGVSQTVAVDLLHRVLKGVAVIKPGPGEPSFGNLLFNAGIYREWKGSDAYQNIDVARKIMIQVADGITGHVGFLRNQNSVITEKDFEKGGILRDSMISVLK